MDILLYKNEQQYGPYTPEQVLEYVQQGHFTLEDHACIDGQNWVLLSQVPGFSQGAPAQPAQAHVPQMGVQVPQAKVTGATEGTSKKKKIILFSSIGFACLAGVIAGLVIFFGGGDKKETGDQVANDGRNGTTYDDQEGKEGNDIVASSGADEGDLLEGSNLPAPGSKVKSLGDVPLLDRIASDSLAVGLIDYGTILEKGGQEIISLLPPDVPPQLSTVLKDPSTLGLDSSVPLQVVFSAYDGPGEDGLLGIAGKLEDAAKFKTVLGLLPGFDNSEEKEGYELYVVPDSSLVCLGIAKDFFVIWGLDGGPSRKDDLVLEMEKFIHSDGSDSLVSSSESFQAFAKKKHDAAIWINGKAITELPSEEKLPEELNSLFSTGSGVISLDFENGEAILAGVLDVPEDFMRLGSGGLSDGMTNLIPSKALTVLSLSLNMKLVEDFVVEVLLPSLDIPVDLDETIPQLGIKPRDVIDTFRGEFSIALTEVSMSMAGPTSGEGFSDEAGTEESPFGQPPVEPNPFGESPSPGAIQGGPSGGPPVGGLPAEFIFAASVDPTNWDKLKTAPPVAMGMGLAVLQGLEVAVKEDRLIIASKKHAEEATEGVVQNKVSGSEQSLFKDNDFALKLDLMKLAKLEGAPIPPPAMDLLKKLDYLAVTGKSDESGGSGSLRIGFLDKQANSLKGVLELVPVFQKLGVTSEASFPGEGF